jgi:hypothetical protein
MIALEAKRKTCFANHNYEVEQIAILLTSQKRREVVSQDKKKYAHIPQQVTLLAIFV